MARFECSRERIWAAGNNPANPASIPSNDQGGLMRAPLGRRALIRIASWIVPSRLRSTWLAERYAELFGWWYLVERGEPVRHGGAAFCRRAFADAFSERLGGRDPSQIARAPMFVPIV